MPFHDEADAVFSAVFWVKVCESTRILDNQGGRESLTLRRRTRQVTAERLESRRLLAQMPHAIVDYGGRCGDEIVHSQTPGVAYFVLASPFTCGTSVGGPTIYRTDGSASGTYGLGPEGGQDSVSIPLEVGDDVYYSETIWNAPGVGSFYRSDGTPNGAIRLSSEATAWEFKGDLYYVPHVFTPGSSDERRTELRRITEASNELVREIGNVSRFARAGQVVLFTVDKSRGNGFSSVGRELWQTDGSTNGTIMLADRDSNAVVGGEFENGRAWFGMRDEHGVYRTWSTDGTKEGTFPLETEGGTLGVKFGAYYLVEPSANSGVRTLKATDGVSVNDLVELAKPSPGRSMLTFQLGDELYFDADGQLWKTDGTAEGTQSLTELGSGVRHELRIGEPFPGRQYHATERYFYFEQEEPVGLFRVNRSTGETTRIANEAITLRAGTGAMLVYRLDSNPSSDLVIWDDSDAPREFAELGVTMVQALLTLSDQETVLFQGSSELEGEGYWLTDGTARGTYKVSEFPVGDFVDAVLSEARDFFQVGNSIIFDAIHTNASGTDYEGKMFAFELNGPNSLAGDLDGNGTVEFSDFLQLAEALGGTNVVQADVDRDGGVTLEDFFLLKSNFGKSTKSYL